ncbi:MAG: MobC family plasmid mobilization relaxosome protein [[Clostridium] sporosphaeroides]|uniref:MobC family plasmid mobilization relaxosome protein n=1 Tax=Faecalispora sporosphaeroides TaxID=1549 RepID=A0A928KWA4_9FIRM|nr:MobC family plasmid mobilization relaxosome protein [Faecalispora sporosphaeroides]
MFAALTVRLPRGTSPPWKIPLLSEGTGTIERSGLILKSERFNIRMTTQEKAAILGRAKKAGRTASEFMIDTALNRKIIVIDSLPEIVRELKAIGRNFNQLTVLCNMGKVQAIKLDEFEEKLADIHSALRKLTEVL